MRTLKSIITVLTALMFVQPLSAQSFGVGFKKMDPQRKKAIEKALAEGVDKSIPRFGAEFDNPTKSTKATTSNPSTTVTPSTPKKTTTSKSSTTVRSNNYTEDFVFDGYVKLKNGSPNIEEEHYIGKCNLLRFEINTNDRINVQVLDKGKVLQTSTIIPSQATILINSDNLLIIYRDNGVLKAVSVVDSSPTLKECILCIDNKSSGEARLWGDGRFEGIYALANHICKYRGDNFHAQYTNLVHQLEKLTWQKIDRESPIGLD